MYLCKGWCKKARNKRQLVCFATFLSRILAHERQRVIQYGPQRKQEAPRKRSLSAGFFRNSTSQIYLCKGWCKKARNKRQLVGFVVSRVKYWLTSKASNPVWHTKNKPSQMGGVLLSILFYWRDGNYSFSEIRPSLSRTNPISPRSVEMRF